MSRIARNFDWIVPLLIVFWCAALAIWSNSPTNAPRQAAPLPHHSHDRLELLERRVDRLERALERERNR